MIPYEIRLLTEANEEIKSLRHRNERMALRLNMFDDVLKLLHTKPASHQEGMSPNVSYEIEKYLNSKSADEDINSDVLKSITHKGHFYVYEHKTAKDGVDICLATKDPLKYCNGVFLFSTKDPGDGKAFVVVWTNNPEVKIG